MASPACVLPSSSLSTFYPIPTRTRSHPSKRSTSLHLLHHCPAHQALHSLLKVDEYDVWNDLKIKMEPEHDCVRCKITTICSTDRKNHPHATSSYHGEMVFIDIVHLPSSEGLTSMTTFPFYLILVDAYSRYSSVYGLHDKTTTTVICTLEQYDRSLYRNILRVFRPKSYTV